MGAHFGVVLVADGDEEGYVTTEVATFRSDGAYSDGRHPDAVRYTLSAEEDVKRRDFTINGLLFDPLRGEGVLARAEEQPQVLRLPSVAQDDKSVWLGVLDFVGGVGDLEAGIVRAIGRAELRFEEDHLRMLRGVRFAARFGFAIEDGTKAAMRALACRLSAVSRERVRDELTKMLTEGQARRAFELLDETGLLVEVLPEIARMKGVEQPPQYHPEGDVWIHTLGLLGQLEEGCSATEILRRFRFSNEESHQILALVENHMRFADAGRMRASTLKRFFRLDGFEEHLALHRMDCTAGGGNLEHWEFVRERWLSMPEETVRPRLLITGRELIAAGYAPGAGFKEMLRAVEDAQLEGAIATLEEALQLIGERFPLPGS